MTDASFDSGTADPLNDSDGMHDSAAERELVAATPPLGSALESIDRALLDAYTAHDRRALQNQGRYRVGIFVTAWGGSLAVIFAVAQLAFKLLRPEFDLHAAEVIAERFELALIVLTLIGVVIGLRLAQLEHWLLDRFKAEQLRLLKFRMILDPRLWKDAAERAQWEQDLVAQRDAILNVTRHSLEHESERDVLPLLPSLSDCDCVTDDNMQVLIEYYRRTRIETQRRYFARAARKGTRLLDNPRLLPLFFFASVLMVAAHVAIEQVRHRFGESPVDGSAPNWEAISITLIALSVALPVVWAGIRTWRSARESTRNVARSAARLHMLNEMQPRLDGLRRTDAANALCQLQLLELVLESDQREWLRLMREVEWYG